MKQITLNGSLIRFDTPCHIAMVEVTPEHEDKTISIIHVAGKQSHGGFTYVGEFQPPQFIERTSALEVPGIPPAYLEMFPKLAEIDLTRPPRMYRIASSDDRSGFRFEAGRRYKIFVLSDVMIDTVVTAV